MQMQVQISKLRSVHARLEARLRDWPASLILALGLSFIGVIALLKLTVGRGAPVVDFFLIPVAFVGWHAHSRRVGYVAAVCAAAVSVHLTMLDNPNALLGPTIVSAGPRLILYFVILSLLGHARRTQGELECLAGTDNLTGALNGRTFAIDAQRELERSRRSGSWLSLLCLDIDDFKAINDTGGHVEGDRVLREVGSALRRSVRSSDIVARLGGDEFVVLMPETGAKAAACAAARLRAAPSRRFVCLGERRSPAVWGWSAFRCRRAPSRICCDRPTS